MNLPFLHSHGSTRIYDVQISRRVLNGEKALFELLAQPYCRILHATVGRLFRRQDTIDEIILKTYANAVTNLYQFYGQVSFRAWTISIALRESRRCQHWPDALQKFNCISAEASALTDDQKLTSLLYRVAGLGEREISFCLGGRPERIRQEIKLIRDMIKKGTLLIPDSDHAGQSPEAFLRTFMQTYLNNTGGLDSCAANASDLPESEDGPIPRMKDEHLSNLMLCSRIRAGFMKGVEMDRIKKYADWYWTHHLLTHFKSEEKMIFPILGSNHILVRKALREHRRLKRHFESRQDIHRMLNRIEEELEAHVRFEEMVLFKEIEKTGDNHTLHTIEALHQGGDANDSSWQDRFWE